MHIFAVVAVPSPAANMYGSPQVQFRI